MSHKQESSAVKALLSLFPEQQAPAMGAALPRKTAPCTLGRSIAIGYVAHRKHWTRRSGNQVVGDAGAEVSVEFLTCG